jgi:hypothetical protein
MFDDAEQAGMAVNWPALVSSGAISGGVVYMVVRGLASMGPAAANELGKAFNEMMASAAPAKRLIAATLNPVEREFFAERGVARPSRWQIEIAGPALTLMILAAAAIPIGLLAFFFFGSLSGPASGAGPLGPTVTPTFTLDGFDTPTP